jgi:hypothetical protein
MKLFDKLYFFLSITDFDTIKMDNRVRGGFPPPLPTPPSMRVRTGGKAGARLPTYPMVCKGRRLNCEPLALNEIIYFLLV